MDTKRQLKNIPCPAPDLEGLRKQLLALRSDMIEKGKQYKFQDEIHPHHKASALNLIQYLALRKNDIRFLQLDLSNWGLSSLGRSERKIQASIDMVLHNMHLLLGKKWTPKDKPPLCFEEGRARLEENALALLGGVPPHRRARIMLTMPSEASTNYQLIHDLMENGMGIARINCAHDNPEIWSKIISNVRKAEEATGNKCLIHMDLGGPKLRTSVIAPGNAVLKVRPTRNEYGEVSAPAIVRFWPAGQPLPPNWDVLNLLPVPGDWLEKLHPGDTVRFRDARKSNRKIKIVGRNKEECIGELSKTAYFVPGMVLERDTRKGKPKLQKAELGMLPPTGNFIQLREGEHLILTRNDEPGAPPHYSNLGVLESPAKIGCTLPEALTHVKEGEPIWFDDGKIGTAVEAVSPKALLLRVKYAEKGGAKLRMEKGINLPETRIDLPALTDEDLEHLPFVAEHADTVGLSFANSAEDVKHLITEIRNVSERMPGIILKIETARGFDNLPEMLLAAMEVPTCGVMIARGDLAIECGFGRLAELQEEILWVCEAAHVPVIWATQVLENLAKSGVHTRSEVTDAAMGQRAECIMLNKGEHIVTATRALDEILSRMQGHQNKKRSMHRSLRLAERFFEG